MDLREGHLKQIHPLRSTRHQHPRTTYPDGVAKARACLRLVTCLAQRPQLRQPILEHGDPRQKRKTRPARTASKPQGFAQHVQRDKGQEHAKRFLQRPSIHRVSQFHTPGRSQ
jgi:hypothetical protein